MISSVVKPEFVWLVNTPKGPRSELAPGDGVISGIVSWGYMRSNRVLIEQLVLLDKTHRTNSSNRTSSNIS